MSLESLEFCPQEKDECPFQLNPFYFSVILWMGVHINGFSFSIVESSWDNFIYFLTHFCIIYSINLHAAPFPNAPSVVPLGELDTLSCVLPLGLPQLQACITRTDCGWDVHTCGASSASLCLCHLSHQSVPALLSFASRVLTSQSLCYHTGFQFLHPASLWCSHKYLILYRKTLLYIKVHAPTIQR